MVHWKQTLISFLRTRKLDTLKADLKNQWKNLYPEEKEDIYHFLYLNRLHKLFLYLICYDMFLDNYQVPWLLTARVLLDNKRQASTLLLNEIHQLNPSEKPKDHISQLTELIYSLEELKKEQFSNRLASLKKELLTSLDIARSEGLEDQQEVLLEELKSISPKEFAKLSVVSEKKRQHAQRILKKLFSRSPKEPLQFNSETLNSEERELVNQIFRQSFAKQKVNKVKPSDLAFLFRSLGAVQEGTIFIEQSGDSDEKDWNLLEYYFEGRQFINLLEHCSYMKQKYNNTPDLLLSIYYIEAQASWELGEKEKALEIMSQIDSLQPGFKSVEQILARWKDERFE